MTSAVEPFIFAAPSGGLFGCFYHPNAERQTNTVAVIVSPLGSEYENTHRGLRVLSERLSRQGIAALRFDLAGVGDSAGDPTNVDPAMWLEDVRRAIRVAKRRSGAERVLLIGVRFGAILAAAVSALHQIDGLVLWEPVDPIKMIDEWKKSDALEASAHGSVGDASLRLLGWRVSEDWLSGVEAYSRTTDVGNQHTLVLGDVPSLLKSFQAQRSSASSESFWAHNLRDVLVPSEAIEVICDFASESAT